MIFFTETKRDKENVIVGMTYGMLLNVKNLC